MKYFRYQVLALLMIFITALMSCDSNQQHFTDNNPIVNHQNETKEMVNRLKLIIESTDPMGNSFLNDRRLKLMSEMISKRNEYDLDFNIKLAIEMLRVGESRKAANIFEKILYDKNFSKKANSRFKRHIRSYLAISLMRVGEQSNCVMLHGSESCIFPLSVEAVHLNQEGSMAAINELSLLLNEFPEDLVSKWLYNIAAQTLGIYPEGVPEKWLIPMSLFQSENNIQKFLNVAADTNTAIIDLAGGSITEDFNEDGYIDIMASSWGVDGQLRLLLNDKNNAFIDDTTNAGLDGLVGGLNIIQADFDNDGDQDVLVLRGAWMHKNGRHPNSLLRNEGNGQFTDVTKSSGLLSFNPTQAGAWGDYNNDGWIDLFIGNEVTSDQQKAELYKNNKDGTFTNVANLVGLDLDGFVKGATWGDYNNDGRLDLYVSKLGSTNQLLKNTTKDGNIRFIDVSINAGVQEPINSFPTWFWDYNNDGFLDIFVADYSPNAFNSSESISFDEAQAYQIISSYLGVDNSGVSPKLFKNNGDETFTDVTIETNINFPFLAMGANFGDINNDGFLDMYIGTGAPDFRTIVPNRMFLNKEGKYFQDVTFNAGVGHLQKGHGISFADFDNDGDQDIYAVIGGAYSGDFFQNALFLNPGFDNNWITLNLEGSLSNRSAIGAKVKVSVLSIEGISRSIYRTVTSGGSFGASSLQLEIGLGKAGSINEIKINWPSGIISTFKNVEINQIIKIIEGENHYQQLNLEKLIYGKRNNLSNKVN